MGSLFDGETWRSRRPYVTAEADFRHHGLDPAAMEIGEVCLITFSAGLFRRVLERVPWVDETFAWPYSTTPLKRCRTEGGTPFALHFPSYGGPRIANSLEQLAACGVRYVLGLGVGGTPRPDVAIGDIVVLEGAVRGDGVSRYYVPDEFPAVADFALTARLCRELDAHHERYHRGLSFGTDALYREGRALVERLRELGVLSLDLESSAFLTVGRRLGLKCCWAGVISDRLVEAEHEGNIHPQHVMETLLRLSDHLLHVIEGLNH